MCVIVVIALYPPSLGNLASIISESNKFVQGEHPLLPWLQVWQVSTWHISCREILAVHKNSKKEFTTWKSMIS